MRQVLKRLLQFTLFALCVIAVVWSIALSSQTVETLLVANRTDEGGLRLRTEEFESRFSSGISDLDFLFLGSSTCYCGIDPYVLEANGFSAFSLCSSAQKLGNSLAVLEYAKGYCSPDVVVIEMFPELWSGPLSSVECERDWTINGPRLPLERIEPYNPLLKVYFSLYEYLGVTRKPHPMVKGDMYSGLGFIERNRNCLRDFNCGEKVNYIMPDEYLEVLREVVDEENVIVVIPPVLCGLYFEIDILGLKVINGNDWPGSRDKSNYYDDHHLVASGAKSYSGWLLEKLIILNTDPSL
tara:strand:+ start:119 stop:1009 length:891 start_codon:yes stop_codon:yes gene_type:complete